MQNSMLVGLLVSLVVQFAKAHPWIPLSEKNIPAVRALVTLLSVIAGVALAYFEGPQAFLKLDHKALLLVASEAAWVLVGAVGSYYALLNKPKQ